MRWTNLEGGAERANYQMFLSELCDLLGVARRGTGAKWDAMMRNARQQGERYVFLLDKSQPVPPFLLVCDVGHCLELYAAGEKVRLAR